MRILKNRLFLAAVCLLLAGFFAFGVIPSIYKNQDATAKVLRLAAPVAKGELIESASLETVEMGVLNLPAGIITDKAEVAGKYAQADLSRGDFVFADKIGDYILDKTLDDIMDRNLRLVTVTAPSTAAGLSGHLRRGDIVTVVVFIEAKERYTADGVAYDPSRVEIYPELSGLTVYGVENAQTHSTEWARELLEEEGRSAAADPVPKLVTLIVTPEQALKLVEAEYSGKLHIVFEKRLVE